MERTQTDGSEDVPSFELPIENELLILKLKAEFGAECSPGHENIPPDVVNEFLRSVYKFEQKFREAASPITQKLFDKIGKPFFRRADSIPESQISIELKRLKSLLNQHRIELDVLGEYPDRQIYKFITEEFFHEEMEISTIDGYMLHFCYEDFHPNYELEIRQRSLEFLLQWFNRQIGEYSWQLADTFIHPDGRDFQKDYVLKRIRHVFDAYIKYIDWNYELNDVQFEWDDKRQCGKGFVKGNVSYNAETESGEMIAYDGPFEFYLSNSGTWWSIFYFVFPGFVW